jgi:hypothetical protein
MNIRNPLLICVAAALDGTGRLRHVTRVQQQRLRQFQFQRILL